MEVQEGIIIYYSTHYVRQLKRQPREVYEKTIQRVESFLDLLMQKQFCLNQLVLMMKFMSRETIGLSVIL